MLYQFSLNFGGQKSQNFSWESMFDGIYQGDLSQIRLGKWDSLFFLPLFVGAVASFCAEATLIASSLSAALLTAKDQMASGRTRAHTPFPINEEGKKRRVKSDGMGGAAFYTTLWPCC